MSSARLTALQFECPVRPKRKIQNTKQKTRPKPTETNNKWPFTRSITYNQNAFKKYLNLIASGRVRNDAKWMAKKRNTQAKCHPSSG